MRSKVLLYYTMIYFFYNQDINILAMKNLMDEFNWYFISHISHDLNEVYVLYYNVKLQKHKKQRQNFVYYGLQ